MDINPSLEAHRHALATNPEYRLMEQVDATPWQWEVHLARKRFRNTLVAVVPRPLRRWLFT